MENYYSYMRISTKEESDKQSFARQESSLNTYAEANGFEYLYQLSDDCTGSTFNRPEWIRLEKSIHSGDTVVFKDVSRFTRQATEGYQKYMELMQKGINLVFIDNPTISTGYIKNLMKISNEHDLVVGTVLESTIKLLLIVELDRVQKEREILIQRIKQGIEASDKQSGRPKGTLDKMSDSLREDIVKFLGDRSIKQVDLMNKHSISRNTLKKYVEIVRAEQSQIA